MTQPAPKPQTLQPTKPEELWLLWDDEVEDYIQAIDECGNPILACKSKQDALECAAFQNDVYDMNCYPVRVI